MSEVVSPSQGLTLEIAKDTAFGTPDSYAYIRCNRANSTFPTQTRKAVPQANSHAHPGDFRDTPVDYKAATESAMTLALNVRKHTSTGSPPICTLLQAAGYTTTAITGDGAVDTGATTTAFSFKVTKGQDDGMAVLIQTAASVWEPTLLADVTGVACVPLFALSAAPAEDYTIKPMLTCTPRTEKLSASDTISFKYTIRATDGSNVQTFTYKGCADQLDSLEISPNTPLEFLFAVHVGDVAMADGTYTAPTYIDGTREIVVTGDNFRCHLAQGNATTGGLTPALSGIKSATISFGMATKPIYTIGGTGNVNDIQGYVSYVASQPRITINALFDTTKWSDFESTLSGGTGTNPDTAIEFVTRVHATTDPAILIAFPRCNLIEPPSAIEKDESGYVSCTLVYGADCSGFSSATELTVAGSQPMFIAINSEAA